MNNKWHYVKTDGNPDKEGIYQVVLIYDEYSNGMETGRKLAEVDTRLFADAKDYENWIMCDQPDSGLVWTEQTGSAYHETVWAWREIVFPKDIELPEGVVRLEEE